MSSVDVPQEGDGVVLYFSGGDAMELKILCVDGEIAILQNGTRGGSCRIKDRLFVV